MDRITEKVTSRRINGWQYPWDRMQIFSWIGIIFLKFFLVFTSLPLPYFPLIPCFFICFYLWNIIWMIILTSYDPSPASARNMVPIMFDRTKYQHVIVHNFCNICQTSV